MTQKGKGGDVEITKQKRKGPTAGGKLEIRAGSGARGAPGGDIIFTSGDGIEAFRIKPDGKVFIRGERCAHDKELYDAMCDFFKGAKAEYP
jgi:hypothetical protein